MSIVHSVEVAFTDFIARHAWRYLRPFLKRHLSPRCAQCVLSSRYEPLDAQGLCRECREQKAPSVQAAKSTLESSVHRARLDELLNRYAGSTPGPHDALILMSGGKDSAYLMHRISREYPKLRLLSVTVDNGFMSPHALDNLRNVLSFFDVAHVTLHPKPSFVRNVFRYTLKNLAQYNGYTTVDMMDAFITFDHAKNFAAASGIPIVICGMSAIQSEIFCETRGLAVESPTAFESAPLDRHAGIKLRDVFTDEEMLYWFDGSRLASERVPHFVLPFTVWSVNEEEILAEVDRLGLISKKRSRPLVTNNALIPVIGMAEVARFGYCSWEMEFARMVREGKSHRDYWLALFEMLEYSTKTGRFVNRTVNQTLARLGLSKRELGIPD